MKKFVSGLALAAMLLSGLPSFGVHKVEAAVTSQEDYRVRTVNYQLKSETITVPVGVKVTRVNKDWDKTKISYNYYKLVSGKRVKQVIVSEVYIKAKYVTVSNYKVAVPGATAYYRIYTPPAPPVPVYKNIIKDLWVTGVHNTIKTNADRNWGTDYDMVAYEIQLQTAAYNRLLALKIDNKVKQDILTAAYLDWGFDFDMLEYEYQLQLDAYNRTH
ncbi:hypothetical protein J1P26_18160 [Neobacillus sp. MM2021_6]|uniref:hypothetical protein n=1 Tax=Bacillaceae TaxID=186817 RepID=UPI00140AB6CA|nr:MULTISPECIES: hypothetical protein [Bacillaceae]MBO0961633.1 hypothetical protein [Neobacillus sp. MM2021_6]NHC19452.1 hypothetical protein [Bacillus sp. MM2020_4]